MEANNLTVESILELLSNRARQYHLDYVRLDAMSEGTTITHAEGKRDGLKDVLVELLGKEEAYSITYGEGTIFRSHY